MVYKVVVRVSGRWQEVGLRHLTVSDAKEAARAALGTETYLIVPCVA